MIGSVFQITVENLRRIYIAHTSLRPSIWLFRCCFIFDDSQYRETLHSVLYLIMHITYVSD